MVDRAALRTYIRSIYESERVVSDNGREFPLSPTGISEEQGEAIRDSVMAEGATRTLETGFGLGLSALFLAEGLLASGDPSARHVAVDPLQKALFDDVGLRVIHEAGLSEVVELVREPSSLALPRLVDDALNHGGKIELGIGSVGAFDVAFIDGDHHFENAFLDIYYSFALVKPEGLIIIDDVLLPAVGKALSYFENNLVLHRLPSPIGSRIHKGKILRRGGAAGRGRGVPAPALGSDRP
ncbi:MAG: class I SAM-dependent methyltransferase [Actinomycetota bacterium]